MGVIGREPVTDDQSRVVQDRDQIERGLRRLSVDQRAVIVLHHYLGLHPEISMSSPVMSRCLADARSCRAFVVIQ